MNKKLLTRLTGLLLVVMLLGTMPGAVVFADSPFVEPEVEVLHTFEGENIGDHYGWVSENLGDLNGDGTNDFIITAVLNSEAAPGAGKAYVYSGADFSELNTVVGEAEGELFGYSAASAGDVNADGTPDYLVSGAGRVVAYSGANHSVIREWSEPMIFFGADVDGAGDVNGDGYDDVLVGAPFASFTFNRAGRVYVFSGKDGSLLWTRDGQSEEAFLGSGVGRIGFMDGDDAPELAAAAHKGGKANRGQVYVLSGATGSVHMTLEASPPGTAEVFGRFFASGAGDINDDGVADIYVGDYADKFGGGEGTGSAYVFSGAYGSLLYKFTGENKEDGLGPGRGVGDVNGDGYGDLIIAAYTNEDGGVRKGGKGYLFSGQDGSVLRTMTSRVKDDFVGVDAISVGDLNGDGLSDYLLTGVNFFFTHLDHSYVIAGRE